MLNAVKKIALWGIYAGTAIVLVIPLLVDNRLFFPFISTKVFLFRIIVEVLLLLYLVLNLASDEQRPRFNWLTVFVTFFIFVAAVSSFLGPDFYRGFWGDIERGDGILLWLHLLAFLVILTGTLRFRATWHAFLDISLGVGILMSAFAIGQARHAAALLATSGDRVDAALGNPAFFATYLLFQIAFAAYLLACRRPKWLKVYYGALILLFAALIPFTQTRGAIIGLAAGVLAAAFLWVFTNRESRVARFSGIAVILVVAAAAGG